MPWHLYTPESFPATELMGRSGYTPEFLRWLGVQLPPLKAGIWTKLPDRFETLRHKDWRDKAGERQLIQAEDILKPIAAQYKNRGVVLMDHAPSELEVTRVVREAKEANLAYRMSVVENYESQVRDREVTGTGRTRPTPYEDQCYDILGLTKPYSVEAFRAQRHPGEAVGEQIVAALERLEQRRKVQPKEHVPEPVAAP